MKKTGYYACLLLLLGWICGCVQQSTFSQAEVEAEARAFIDGYAQDLCCNDGDAITARYHRSGTYFVIQEQKTLVPFDSIRTRYDWATQGRNDPFQFHDLTYEVLGPDAVVVIGHYIWSDSFDPNRAWSYTGLLTREEGELRIRIENEAGSFWGRFMGLAERQPDERDVALGNLMGRVAKIIGEAESTDGAQVRGLEVIKKVTEDLLLEAKAGKEE